MFVKAHEREAQIGLSGVAFGIELDQWVADEPAEPRDSARVKEGALDHIPGNSEAASAHVDEAIYMSDRILIMSPRPGRIERTITVEILRPRDRSHPEFLRLRSEILQLLYLAGNASVED